MVPLAGLIDTAFLGHLDDVRFLNGVALATVIFNVIYWSFNFFRMGTTGPVAQAMGQADELSVWLIGVRNSLLALGTGVAICLSQKPIAAVGFFAAECWAGGEGSSDRIFQRTYTGRTCGPRQLCAAGLAVGPQSGQGGDCASGDWQQQQYFAGLLVHSAIGMGQLWSRASNGSESVHYAGNRFVDYL